MATFMCAMSSDRTKSVRPAKSGSEVTLSDPLTPCHTEWPTKNPRTDHTICGENQKKPRRKDTYFTGQQNGEVSLNFRWRKEVIHLVQIDIPQSKVGRTKVLSVFCQRVRRAGGGGGEDGEQKEGRPHCSSCKFEWSKRVHYQSTYYHSTHSCYGIINSLKSSFLRVEVYFTIVYRHFNAMCIQGQTLFKSEAGFKGSQVCRWRYVVR